MDELKLPDEFQKRIDRGEWDQLPIKMYTHAYKRIIVSILLHAEKHRYWNQFHSCEACNLAIDFVKSITDTKSDYDRTMNDIIKNPDQY